MRLRMEEPGHKKLGPRRLGEWHAGLAGLVAMTRKHGEFYSIFSHYGFRPCTRREHEPPTEAALAARGRRPVGKTIPVTPNHP